MLKTSHLRAQQGRFRALSALLQASIRRGSRQSWRRNQDRGSEDEESDGSDEDLERANRNAMRQQSQNSQTGRRKHIEFLFGFSLGFILGGIMLCFIWDDNVSKFYRAGVLFGVICNVSVSPEHHSSSIKANKNRAEKVSDENLEKEFEGFSDVIH